MSPPLPPSSFTRIAAGAMAVSLLGLLTACGGGGGGSSGGGSLTPASFTSWDTLPTGQPVNINGMSVTRTSGGVVTDDTAGSTASVLYNSRASSGLRGFTFTTPSTSASWTISSGSTISCGAGVCALSNPAQTIIAAVSDPYDASTDWNYQSFGVWSVTNGSVSAMSYGAPTAFSALPTLVNAAYAGELIGRYSAVAGDDMNGNVLLSALQFGLRANVTASVTINGGTREVNFSSTNSRLEAVAFPEFNDNRFNIPNATLAISGGANSFTGAITSGSGSNAVTLTGTADGRFYGPAAEELGGTFVLEGAGGRAVVGGFGAKR